MKAEPGSGFAGCARARALGMIDGHEKGAAVTALMDRRPFTRWDLAAYGFLLSRADALLAAMEEAGFVEDCSEAPVGKARTLVLSEAGRAALRGERGLREPDRWEPMAELEPDAMRVLAVVWSSRTCGRRQVVDMVDYLPADRVRGVLETLASRRCGLVRKTDGGYEVSQAAREAFPEWLVEREMALHRASVALSVAQRRTEGTAPSPFPPSGNVRMEGAA